MSKYLDRDALLGSRLRTQELEIEGLGTALVRELTGAVATQASDMRAKNIPQPRINAYYVIGGIIDDEGRPVFKSTDIDKILEMLGQRVINEVALLVLRLSGLVDDEEYACPACGHKFTTADLDKMAMKGNAEPGFGVSAQPNG